MKQKQNNRIVVDLNKVAYASLLFVTDNNGVRYERYKMLNEQYMFSINGVIYVKEEKLFGTDKYLYDVAKKRNSLDIWYPELTLQLSCSHKLVYTGDKALSIWKAWNTKQFGKK